MQHWTNFNLAVHHTKIFTYTIKICLSFIGIATDRSHKVTDYIVKQNAI